MRSSNSSLPLTSPLALLPTPLSLKRYAEMKKKKEKETRIRKRRGEKKREKERKK
jgi:hypothetical protein